MAALSGLLALNAGALAAEDEDYQLKQWQELDVSLPAAPKDENLESFYVSATASNRFFVDLASLSVGSDGVVRYVLVIQTAGGARNVNFEGMRCETQEYKIYASGRRDGEWSKARNPGWAKVRDIGENRYHAALYLDYFCPGGYIVHSPDEAKAALKRGGQGDLLKW